jgi:hypothetical protein
MNAKFRPKAGLRTTGRLTSDSIVISPDTRWPEIILQSAREAARDTKDEDGDETLRKIEDKK